MEQNTLTVKEIFEALKKNGYPWATETYLSDGGKSCAIGQAARNLQIRPYVLNQALNHLLILDDNYKIRGIGVTAVSCGDAIEVFNDRFADKYEDVVEFAEKILSPYFEKEITFQEDDFASEDRWFT